VTTSTEESRGAARSGGSGFHRVLLKLSGEALLGDRRVLVDAAHLERTVQRHADRLVEVDVALRGQPAAEIAVAEHAFEHAVLADGEDDPGPVRGDLLQRVEHAVAGEHHEAADVALDDHERPKQ